MSATTASVAALVQLAAAVPDLPQRTFPPHDAIPQLYHDNGGRLRPPPQITTKQLTVCVCPVRETFFGVYLAEATKRFSVAIDGRDPTWVTPPGGVVFNTLRPDTVYTLKVKDSLGRVAVEKMVKTAALLEVYRLLSVGDGHVEVAWMRGGEVAVVEDPYKGLSERQKEAQKARDRAMGKVIVDGCGGEVVPPPRATFLDDSYEVKAVVVKEREGEGGSTPTITVASQTVTTKVTCLVPDTVYALRVRSHCPFSGYYGSWSPDVLIHTLPLPTITSYETTSTTASISLTPPTRLTPPSPAYLDTAFATHHSVATTHICEYTITDDVGYLRSGVKTDGSVFVAKSLPRGSVFRITVELTPAYGELPASSYVLTGSYQTRRRKEPVNRRPELLKPSSMRKTRRSKGFSTPGSTAQSPCGSMTSLEESQTTLRPLLLNDSGHFETVTQPPSPVTNANEEQPPVLQPATPESEPKSDPTPDTPDPGPDPEPHPDTESSASSTTPSSSSSEEVIVLNPVTALHLVSTGEKSLVFGWTGEIESTKETRYRMKIFNLSHGKTILPWGFLHEDPNKRMTQAEILDAANPKMLIPGQDLDDRKRTFESTFSGRANTEQKVSELSSNSNYGVKMCAFDSTRNQWLRWCTPLIMTTAKAAELSIAMVSHSGVILRPSHVSEYRTELRVSICDGSSVQRLQSFFDPSAELCIEDLSGNMRYVFESRHEQADKNWGSWSNKVLLTLRYVPIDLSPLGDDGIEVNWSSKDISNMQTGIINKPFLVIAAMSTKKTEVVEIDPLPPKPRWRFNNLQQDRYKVSFVQVLQYTDEDAWHHTQRYFWKDQYAAIALIKQLEILVSKIGEESIAIFGVQENTKIVQKLPRPYTLDASSLEQEKLFVQAIQRVRNSFTSADCEGMAKDIVKLEVAVTRLDTDVTFTKKFSPTAQLGGVVSGLAPDKQYSIKLKPQLVAGNTTYWGQWSSVIRFSTLGKLMIDADVVGEDFVHIKWSRAVPFKTQFEVKEAAAIERLTKDSGVGLADEQKEEMNKQVEAERVSWKQMREEKESRKAKRRHRRRAKYAVHEADIELLNDDGDEWGAVMREFARIEEREKRKEGYKRAKVETVQRNKEMRQKFEERKAIFVEQRIREITNQARAEHQKPPLPSDIVVMLTDEEEELFAYEDEEVSSDSTDDGGDHPYLSLVYKMDTEYEVWVRVEGEKEPLTYKVPWDENQFLIQGLASGVRHAIKVKQKTLTGKWSLWSNLIMIQTLTDIRVKVHEVGEGYVSLSCSRAPATCEDDAEAEDTKVITLSHGDDEAVAGYQVRVTYRSTVRGKAKIPELAANEQEPFEYIKDVALDSFSDVFLVTGLNTDSLYSISIRVRVKGEYWGQWSELVTFHTAKAIVVSLNSLAETKLGVSWLRPPLDVVEPKQPILTINTNGEYEAVYQTQMAVNNVLHWKVVIEGEMPDGTEAQKWTQRAQLMQHSLPEVDLVLNRLRPDSIYRISVQSYDSVGLLSPLSPPLYVATKPETQAQVTVLGEYYAMVCIQRSPRCEEVVALKVCGEAIAAFEVAEEKLARVDKTVRTKKPEKKRRKIGDGKRELTQEEKLLEEGATVIVQDGVDKEFDLRVVQGRYDEERDPCDAPKQPAEICITKTFTVEIRVLQNLQPGTVYSCFSCANYQNEGTAPEWGAWCGPSVFETLAPLVITLKQVKETFVDVSLKKSAANESKVDTRPAYQIAINRNTAPQTIELLPDTEVTFRVIGLARDSLYTVLLRNVIFALTVSSERKVCYDNWRLGFHFRTLPRRPCMPVLYESKQSDKGLVVGFFWRTEKDSDCVKCPELTPHLEQTKEEQTKGALKCRLIDLWGPKYAMKRVVPDQDVEEREAHDASNESKEDSEEADMPQNRVRTKPKPNKVVDIPPLLQAVMKPSMPDTLRATLLFDHKTLRGLLATMKVKHEDLPSIPPTELALRLVHAVFYPNHYATVDYRSFAGSCAAEVMKAEANDALALKMPSPTMSVSHQEHANEAQYDSYYPLIKSTAQHVWWCKDTENDDFEDDDTARDLTPIALPHTTGINTEGSVTKTFGIANSSSEIIETIESQLPEEDEGQDGYLIQVASVISLSADIDDVWHDVGEITGTGFVRIEVPHGKLHNYAFRLQGRNGLTDAYFNKYCGTRPPTKLWSRYSIAVSWKETKPPAACVNLRVRCVSHDAAAIDWNAPADAQSHNQLYYEVLLWRVGTDRSWVLFCKARSFSCILTDLSIKGTFKVTVRAVSTFGPGPLCQGVRFSTLLYVDKTAAAAVAAVANDIWQPAEWHWPYPCMRKFDATQPPFESPFHVPTEEEANRRQLYKQQRSCTLTVTPCLLVPESEVPVDVVSPVGSEKNAGHDLPALDSFEPTLKKIAEIQSPPPPPRVPPPPRRRPRKGSIEGIRRHWRRFPATQVEEGQYSYNPPSPDRLLISCLSPRESPKTGKSVKFDIPEAEQDEEVPAHPSFTGRHVVMKSVLRRPGPKGVMGVVTDADKIVWKKVEQGKPPRCLHDGDTEPAPSVLKPPSRRVGVEFPFMEEKAMTILDEWDRDRDGEKRTSRAKHKTAHKKTTVLAAIPRRHRPRPPRTSRTVATVENGTVQFITKYKRQGRVIIPTSWRAPTPVLFQDGGRSPDVVD